MLRLFDQVNQYLGPSGQFPIVVLTLAAPWMVLVVTLYHCTIPKAEKEASKLEDASRKF